MAQKVRIGLIGAGNFSKLRMLPNFQRLGDVDLTMVANRGRASAEKVAAEFEIAAVADDWREVIESSDVDAVFIGTPPHVHHEMALAALAAGKHVLLQTRIAISAAEAREMHQKAQEARARGVHAMLVPPNPFSKGRKFVKHLIDSGYLGKLRHAMGFNMSASFADPKTPLSAGRNDPALYGPYNAGQLALTYDAMTFWVGHATSLVAHRGWFVLERPATPDGPTIKNANPDEASVIADTTSGAIALNVLNWSVHFPESRIELYGEEGTVTYRMRGDLIMAARAGDQSLQELPIPPEHDSTWAVEDEFVRLIRGEIPEPSFTFWDGVKNMEYVEAVYHSAVEGRRVDLPS
ncbi:MAG TPA: Gfo/Idh/MocA family oxidoreductase [Chloroflexota bacterium]